MSTKVKWFIAIGILLNVILCAGLYANYRLDQVVASLNRPGVLFSEAQSGGLGNGANGGSGSSDWNTSWGDGSGNQIDGSAAPGSGGSSSSDGEVSQSSNTQIANGAQQQINKPIEKIDLLKAGMVIMRKLSWEETQYLYQSGSKDTHSVDELKATRRILLEKLTPEDVQTLRELGAKYGKTLNILDPNVPIQ